MTPAAFTQTETVRDSFVGTRRDETIRRLRSPRRFTALFNTGDATTPLFHAWRP